MIHGHLTMVYSELIFMYAVNAMMTLHFPRLKSMAKVEDSLRLNQRNRQMKPTYPSGFDWRGMGPPGLFARHVTHE